MSYRSIHVFFLSSLVSVYCLLCLFLLSLLLDKREKEMGKRTEKKGWEGRRSWWWWTKTRDKEDRKHFGIRWGKKEEEEEQHIFFIIRQATHVSRMHRTAFCSVRGIEKKRKTISFSFVSYCRQSLFVIVLNSNNNHKGSIG